MGPVRCARWFSRVLEREYRHEMLSVKYWWESLQYAPNLNLTRHCVCSVMSFRYFQCFWNAQKKPKNGKRQTTITFGAYQLFV